MEKPAPKLDRETREALIGKDVDTARISLLYEGKNPDELKLRKDVQDDWEILRRAVHLPESLKQEITQAVHRIIKTQRGLAQKVLPEGILERNLDFYRLMLALNGSIAEKTAAKKIDEESLVAVARTKRTIARDIIQPKLVHHMDRDINDIIDGNHDKPLEDIIEQIISYLKNECLGKKVDNISFYLVNEENYHDQVEQLTKTSIGIPSTKIRREDFEKGKEELGLFNGKAGKSRKNIIHHETNKRFFELKIKGNHLGVLEIDLKPGAELSKIEMEYIEQALTRLDTKIDDALNSKRLDVIAREAHRILDEHGTTDNFEKGIAEFMEMVCLYSTAFEAEVMVDIFGDGKDWFAKKFNDNREISPIEMDNSMKKEVKIPSVSRRVDEKRALVLDISDTTARESDGSRSIIGKVIFRTEKDAEELTNEDHILLRLCSEILSSHILHWRNDLRLRIEGVDDQIARTTMRKGVEDMVKETLTVFYTDIAGYTYICEILKDAFEDEETVKDIETLRAVLEKFLTLIQTTGQMYGGVWDKAVGDMGLMEFGAPIDKKGIDPLGNDALRRRPEFFASNALKAAILVRHQLKEVSAVFREKLLEIAHGKYTSGLKALENLTTEEENALLKKLEDETRLSPKISTTTSVYTGEVGFMKLKFGAAPDWTAIGDSMNSAARVQGTSLKGEIRVPLLTRDLVEPLIKMDEAIPMNSEGESETWSSFFSYRLGMDPKRVKVNFEEYYEGYKNKTGRNVVFTLNIKESRIENIQPNCIMTIDDLLSYEGEEFGIESRRPADENIISFKLKTINPDSGKAVTFRVNIPQAAIEERVVRHKSPLVLNPRVKMGAQNTLMVQDGKLKEFVWKSIEEDQDEQLVELAKELHKSKEKMIVYTKNVPTGCYELMSEKDHSEQNYAVLKIRKDNYVFDVRVSRSKIYKGIEGVGKIMKDTDVLYDFQSFYETIRNKVNGDEPVVFVRKRNFYVVTPDEAEKYLAHILTRSEAANGDSHTGVKCSSNPPAASTIAPPAMKKSGEQALNKPMVFWTKIAQQLETYHEVGNQLLIDNWNEFAPLPKKED